MKLKPQKNPHLNKIINSSLKMVLIALLSIIQLTNQIQISNIDIQNSTISTQTSYTFLLERNDTALNIPTASYLQIKFPSQYVNRITYTNGSNVSCSSVELTSSEMYCTFAGNVLKVYNGFQTVPSIKRFFLTVNNILNPFPAMAYDPFVVSIHYANEASFQQGSLPAQITTNSGKSVCSITNYANNFVYSRGSILISYQSSYISTFNSSYKLLLSMNTSYTNDPLATSISPQISGYSAIGVSGSFKFTVNYSTSINVSLMFPPSTMAVSNLIYMQAYVQNQGSVDWCYVSLSDIKASPMTVSILTQPSIVQQLSTYTFTMDPTTAIFSTDSLLIEFPSSYKLSSLASSSATFFLGIFTTKSFQISGQVINISSLVSTNLLPRTIKFNLTKVMNPFYSDSVGIKLTVITSDGYLRTTGTYSLPIDPGTMKINNFTCTTYQIGYKSSCKLNFTTMSSISTNSLIHLIFPSSGWMTSYSGSNTQCSVISSSPQIKSIFQCRYQESLKSLVLTQFTNWTNVTVLNPFTATVSIQQSSVDVDHRLALPWNVDTYTLGLQSYTIDNFLIDSGKFSIATTKRQIFKAENNSLTFSSTKTMTVTDILVTYTLPFVNGGSYNMRIYLPLQMSGTQNDIRTTYGTIVGYDLLTSLLTIRLTEITLLSNSFTITGFKTYMSTKPITYTMEIILQSTVCYFFSTVISIVQPKQFNTLTINPASLKVYEQNNLSLTISQLQNGDIITFGTSDYNGYQLQSVLTANSSINNSWCSPIGVVNCNADGSISVISSNNADQLLKLTQFNFLIKNSPFVGQSTFVATVYDQTKMYLKQNGTFAINVQQMNTINSNSLSYTSSNPYFNQPTTLTITLTLATPGATTLTITFPTTYSLSSSKCIKNCQLPIINPSNNMFVSILTGQDISVEFQLVNPMDFTQTIAIISKDLMDRNVDYGQVILSAKCQSPCRSCSGNDSSFCLSCYNFSINKTLSGNKCVTACPDGQFQVAQSSMFYCLACPSSCTKCTSNTICQQCKPNFIYFNFTCISICPIGYYLNVNNITGMQQCLTCTSPCNQCSTIPTNCTQCIQNTYLFENNCLTNCPSGYYKTTTNRCSQCSANCSQCQDTTGACNLCITNFYLYENNCYAQCPIAGYAKNITSGRCQLCTTTCVTCGQFINECLYCKSGYFLMNGVCLTQCPDGYYNNAGTRKCQLCQSPCVKCSTTESYCESCIAGRFFYNHQCYEACPDGSYSSTVMGSNNSTIASCTACTWPCNKCADSLACSSCSPPYALNVSSCVLNCGLGNFINSFNRCQQCDTKCKSCNITGCIECSNPMDFLSTQSCVQSCSPLFKNQLTMKCQQCQPPCATCSSNSTTCTQCLPAYYFMLSQSKCYLTCPPLYFAENSYCKLCQQRNANCQQCSIDNVTKSLTCSTCIQGAYFYGYVCIDKCPNDMNVSNNICVSTNCTQVENCQLCSDLKCLSCKALYTLENNVCQFRVISAISNLKAPFPFLILVLCTILSSIALKVYFQKIYIPLYLYSFCGIFEVGCMALWTGLAIMTSRVNLQQQPANFYFATLVILMIYTTINIISFVLKFTILDKDKKFTNWQRQDNKSVSYVISLISLAISFRFQLLMFSKLGNRQSFSAVLQNKQKFFYLLTLNIASIFLVSIPTISLACYLIYLQQEMNYLFFTCIQMATISLIMIILSILAYLTPTQYVLEKKDQYKKGYIEENFVQGKSLTGLLCIEEEYYEETSVVTVEKQADRKAIISEDEISSLNNNNEFIDHMGLIDTKLSTQVLEMNIIDDDQQLQLTDSMQHLILTKNDNISKRNSLVTNVIQPQQFMQNQQNRQQITKLLKKAIIKKQNILKQLVKQENDQIMKEINDNFGIAERQDDDVEIIANNNKRVGRIVKQLYDRYETYGKQDDDQNGSDDLGEEILEQQQQNDYDDQSDSQQNDDEQSPQQQQGNEQDSQQQEMHSSQLLKGHHDINKRTQRKQKNNHKQTILTNHQTLSLTEEDNFIKETIKKQTIEQNLKNIEKIKKLLEQLAKQQRQQQQLKIKLYKLNNDLSSQEYVKLREKIQHDNMTLEDKLSRLNQMYYQRKQFRDNRKKHNKISRNSNFVLDKAEIENNLNQKFCYQGEEKHVQQILPKKVRVQSARKKLIKNVNKIELKTKNQGKVVKKQHNQNLKDQVKKNIDRKKLYSASLTNRVKKSNKLQSINEEDRKSSDTFLYVPMVSQRTNNLSVQKQQPQFIKLHPILPQKELKQQKRIPYLNEDNDKQFIDEEHKSNTSWIEQQNFVPKASPLMFTEPLKQDQPGQTYDLQQQKNAIFQHVDEITENKEEQKIQNKELKENKQIQKKVIKIQYQLGPIETQNKADFQHWPIEPQIQQRIIQAEKLAQSYLKSKKNPKSKLGKYASATLHPYYLPNQSKGQLSGSQSKFTQVNFQKTEILSKDNSIFNEERQSQIQLNYPQGEMLVFQDDEDIIDEILQTEEKSFQRNKNFKESKVLELKLQTNKKIPKRRANRSVINLSPGKY